MGRPNCTRRRTWATVMSRHRWAPPTCSTGEQDHRPGRSPARRRPRRRPADRACPSASTRVCWRVESTVARRVWSTPGPSPSTTNRATPPRRSGRRRGGCPPPTRRPRSSCGRRGASHRRWGTGSRPGSRPRDSHRPESSARARATMALGAESPPTAARATAVPSRGAPRRAAPASSMTMARSVIRARPAAGHDRLPHRGVVTAVRSISRRTVADGEASARNARASARNSSWAGVDTKRRHAPYSLRWPAPRLVRGLPGRDHQGGRGAFRQQRVRRALRQTGEAALLDAANEHDKLLELCRARRARCSRPTVIGTTSRPSPRSATPATRSAHRRGTPPCSRPTTTCSRTTRRSSRSGGCGSARC